MKHASLRPLAVLLLLVIMLLLLIGPSSAQSILPPLAAITDGNLTLYGVDGAPITVDTNMDFYSEMVWSPDGQVLAYNGFDLDRATLLKITDVGGSSPLVLTDNISVGFPIAFTDDSQRIIYAIDTYEPVDDTTPDLFVEIVIQDLTPGAVPELLGRVPYGFGCGGGSSVPADFAYAAEGGGNLGYQHILQPVAGGIVYSRDCVPSSTVMLDTISGEVVTLAQPVTQADLSPDRSLIAGTQRDANQIIIVGLDGQFSETLATEQIVERVWWNATGDALYYSWRREAGSVPATEALVMALGVEVESIPLHEAGISLVNRADGSETILWSGSEYAVGRVIQSPDPNLVFFTVVPSLEDWLQAIESGAASPSDLVATHFAVKLYDLRVSQRSASLRGENLAQATLNAALFQ